MRTLFGDLETYSETPLKCGVHRYAVGAEVLLYAYALDEGLVRVWDATAEIMPAELFDAVADPDCVFVFHNAAFDRTVLRAALPAACPPLHRWRCSMARAYAHSLPGSLERLGEVFNLADDDRKMKEGKELMRLFCIPPPKKAKRQTRATRQTHPGEWQRFKLYGGRDVGAMRHVWHKMPDWNYTGAELALWHRDQEINDRGFAVDVELATAAVRATDAAKARLAARCDMLTGGEVEAATQRDKLLAYILAEHHVSLPDMRADTLERRLDDESLPASVRELIGVRLQASTTSAKKYTRALSSVSADGRIRGTTQFCGAGRTGRWGGRIIQPQNFMRPTMEPEEIELGIAAMKAGAEDLLYA